MLRVLHLSDVVNRYDFIDNVVRHLDPSRFRVMVASFTASAQVLPRYDLEGIPHFVLDVQSRRQYVAAAWKLANIVRHEQIDIIHVHHFDPNLVAWLAQRFGASIRIVVGRHYSDSFYRLPSMLKRHGYLALEQLINRSADRIIVPSSAVYALLVGKQGIPRGKLDLIPYGFDPGRYDDFSEQRRVEVRESLGVNNRFVVATVGRLLLREKGHLYLLDAVKTLVREQLDILWLVVGDGPDRSTLEQAVVRAGLGDNVRMLGQRPDALEIIAASDVVVQPSLEEAFSQVIAEALWMRTPLIATDVSGVRDLLDDQQTGIIVPAADAGSLAQGIRLLYNEPTFRSRLGSQGRAHIESNYTIGSIIHLYESAYRRAIDCQRGRDGLLAQSN